MNAFSELHEDVRRALKVLGFRKPTPIQEMAIPKILHDDGNFILVAPTGSGKTEAALLPVLSKLFSQGVREGGIHILYITPLRALNRDLLDRLSRLFSALGLRVDVRHGDTGSSARRRQALSPPYMLITTPETLQAILWGQRLRERLKSVKYVIIDEVHSLIESKRGCQLAVALERLKLISKEFRVIALSATISDPETALRYFTAGEGGCVIVDPSWAPYDVKVSAVKSILVPSKDSALGFEWVVDLHALAKRVSELVRAERGKVLIFVNTRDMAELLGAYLRKFADFKYGVHHGSLSKEVRTSIERMFKRGDLKAVIATSSLELGIDIGDVDLVIQVMSPRRLENAAQRVGRAGHFITKRRRGIILAANPDDLFESLAIAKLLKNGVIEAQRPMEKCYDVLAHQIVGLVRDYYLDSRDYPSAEWVFRVIRRAYPFKELTKEEFFLVLNFLEKKCKLVENRLGKLVLKRGALNYYFERMSMIPSNIVYDVVDVSEGKVVGELDERFVLKIKPGDTLLLAGIPRMVVEIDPSERKVKTVPATKEARPPEWTGELLPTSYEVAQEVGRLRRLWIDIESFETNIRDFVHDEATLDTLEEFAGAFPEKDLIPHDRRILIEVSERHGVAVIHACLGLNVNRTLALILARFLSEDAAFPLLGYDADSYRIYLYAHKGLLLSRGSLLDAVERALNRAIDLAEDERAFLAEVYSALLEFEKDELAWYFLQVLRRFGLISSDASISKQGAIKLISKYADTPVLLEALREYSHRNLDIERAVETLREIDEGRIEVLFSFTLSNLSFPAPVASRFAIKDLEALILERFRETLLNRKLLYVCLSCGHTKEGTAREPILYCDPCGSSRITAIKPSDSQLLTALKKVLGGEPIDKKEAEKLRYADAFSRALHAYGTRAAMAIAAYGVGHKQALSLLKFYADERSLLEELRNREVTFWRTKGFWS